MSKKINATNVTFSETNMTYRRVLLSNDQKLACEIYINQPKQGQLGPNVTFKPVIRLNVNGVDKLFVVSFINGRRNPSTRYLVNDKYYDIDAMLKRIEGSVSNVHVETMDGTNYYHIDKRGRRTWKEAIVDTEKGVVKLEYTSIAPNQSDDNDDDDTSETASILRIEIPIDTITSYEAGTSITAHVEVVDDPENVENAEMYVQYLGNAR